MKNILLIGVGGTGSKTVDTLFQKVKELGRQNDNNISAIVFDTDAGDIKKIECAVPIPMADNASVGTICDRIGTEYIKEWFPCGDKAIRSQEMFRGASQWRKKSYLAFLNLMNKPKFRSAFVSTLEKMTLDPSAPCEVYIISSVAGGTGSGSFIPIALFAKRYLRKNLGKSPIINAMIALPDIYAESQTPENNTKIYANAYAIFRELNAINLVSRGYNKGEQLKKKTPIRFRIGNPQEPNLGVLFDSMDKSFWTPEAAPFTQVFVLDKIPNVTSVTAHNIVLANSLYSLICTDIGDKFDSEISNHELLHSQNNGSSAIYAGISTSEIRFPKETVLDYIAHKKTVMACEGEWLTLHKAVESKIRENEIAAKEMGRAYTMGDGGYAKIVLEELENDVENNDSKINDIVDRGTCVYDENGAKDTTTNTAEAYFEKLNRTLNKKIPQTIIRKEAIEKSFSEKASDKIAPDTVCECAMDAKRELLGYFTECVDSVKRMKTSLSDAIISLDKRKDFLANKELSLVNGILMQDGKYLHPVTAIVQLSRLRVKLCDAIKKEDVDFADALRKREISDIPAKYLTLDSDFSEGESEDGESKKSRISFKKSAYVDMKELRFMNICSNADEYREIKRSDRNADCYALKVDALSILENLKSAATKQLKYIIFTNMARAIDSLIAKYRAFFVRFEKEKVNLEESTKDVKRRDCGVVDSVINIYSSMEEKDKIFKNVIEAAGPATDKEIAETDDVVGKGVFLNVFSSACAEANQGQEFNDKDASAIRSLFDNMINAYKLSIKVSDGYAEIDNYNVVEAIKASCNDNPGKLADRLKTFFSTACETAKPSIKIDNREDLGDVVAPSNVTVFMMSTNTGRYIKRNADIFDIRLPADQSKEGKIIEACAEQFIRLYSGDDTARVAVVDTMPDNVLYCTGEIMDISPLRVAKFNELGEDNLYFTHYQKAIYNWKHYETEMWNPHLGDNLHLRGYLPYMNEKMEKIEDDKMVKALFYGFWFNRLISAKRIGRSTNKNVFYNIDREGRRNAIKTTDGMDITLENAAQLIKWLRNQDDLINEWSAKFDEEINAMKNNLPNIPSDTQIGDLQRKITTCEYMDLLNMTLFTDDTYFGSVEGKEIKIPSKKKGPSIIEFAYLVKTSEESLRDCDDAERILSVAYDVFLDICSFRANPELFLDRFIRIYSEELAKVFEGLLSTKMVLREEKNCLSYVEQFASWLNSSKVFQNISDAKPLNEDGTLNISDKFNYQDNEGIVTIINKMIGNKPSEKVVEVPAKKEITEEVESQVAVTEDNAEKEEESAAQEVKKGRGRPKKI